MEVEVKGAHKERVVGGIDGKRVKAERCERVVAYNLRGRKKGGKISGEEVGDEPMGGGENLEDDDENVGSTEDDDEK